MSSKKYAHHENQEQLNDMIHTYLEGIINTRDGQSELEVRFGTRGIQPITKQNFDDVVKKLVSLGFTFKTKNAYTLKIQNEYIDQKTGKPKLSLVRTEISGNHDIQEYCKQNRPNEKSVLFTQKMYARRNHRQADGGDHGGDVIEPINFDEFNMRVSLQKEKHIANSSSLARSILQTWNDNKKTFRYINRSTMVHRDFPFVVDLSVVKESHRDKQRYIPEYSFDAAKVLESSPRYEIEIEVVNSMVGPGTSYSNPKHLANTLRRCILYILCGLQNTNYPISYTEKRNVELRLFELLYPEKYNEARGKKHHDRRDKKGDSSDSSSESEGEEEEEQRNRHEEGLRKLRLLPRHFIGPSSYTLQMQNIMPMNDDNDMPNIRDGYTVTDKADGERKLLFIAPKTGRIYLIDTNMNIQFTGAVSKNIKLYNSLLDGEHIVHNKRNEFINVFAAFDVYFVHKNDVRTRLFVPLSEEDLATNFRLPLLVSIVKNIDAHCVSGDINSISPLRIENKRFELATSKKSIFECCGTILRKINEGQMEYNTDGLIFTPANYGVGASRPGEGHAGPLHKTTWDYSFKWKPPMFNTIDFLITTKKGQNTEDIIGNIFQNGTDVSTVDQLSQYKTLILRVGYDEKKHGYLNPCASLIEDRLPSTENIDNEDSYKPAPFYPSCPYDPDAHLCNIVLRPDETGMKQMMTVENDIIDDETIVEFRYNPDRPVHWRWEPLRVRHDKTAEYRNGMKNYGNAYHVANNNWYSIHNPITEEMIATGEGLPNEMSNDDVYYNRSVIGRGIDAGNGTRLQTMTQNMRDFHNLYVKKQLIAAVSKPGYTLIDLAVGKGGDLPKWIDAKLSFVFGIDYSKDNIENKIDGACARYLNYRKRRSHIPAALFIHGDSSQVVKTGHAAITDRYKQITRAIFGEGAKDADLLGRGVYNQYGRGADGFDVCSVQFAIHYFFENVKKLHTFLRNVAECTRVGGHFIGTCYDGEAIFDALRRHEMGESMTIMSKSTHTSSSSSEPVRLWSITKQYHQSEFVDDSSSLGYAIDVYQDSINKTFREYLVSFNYFVQLMENYGFALLTQEEASEFERPLPDGTGTFSQLFNTMQNDIDKNPEKEKEYGHALQMSAEERKISFFNRYFVFRKIRNIDAKKLMSSFLAYAGLQEEHAKHGEEVPEEDVQHAKNVIAKVSGISPPSDVDIVTTPAKAADIVERAEEAKLHEEVEHSKANEVSKANEIELSIGKEKEIIKIRKPTTAKKPKNPIQPWMTKSTMEAIELRDKEYMKGHEQFVNEALAREGVAPIEKIEKKLTRKKK